MQTQDRKQVYEYFGNHVRPLKSRKTLRHWVRNSSDYTVNTATNGKNRLSRRGNPIILEIACSPAIYTMPTSLTSLRQLISGFGNPGTFLRLRTAYKGLDGDPMALITVFTLCDTPHSHGYDTSANSTGKLTLCFLQSLAMSMMNTMLALVL
ncbi:hypothetical protein G6F37_011562 [Rhizopus arrhizus]|nr:hypothetical protein G6F38_011568 [Rhizopus arrhizus]KAG1148678.1 hypothetical protein G6F37_011562 [Rhizopus arrhizus]